MEKTYAQALWNMVSGGMDAKKAVHAISDKLTRDGRSSLLPRVARAFERIAQREAVRNDITLTVAKEADAHRALKEAKVFIDGIEGSARGGLAVGRDLKTQVDDTLIGGWRLEGKELLVDASYKKTLLDLYSRVTRA